METIMRLVIFLFPTDMYLVHILVPPDCIKNDINCIPEQWIGIDNSFFLKLYYVYLNIYFTPVSHFSIIKIAFVIANQANEINKIIPLVWEIDKILYHNFQVLPSLVWLFPILGVSYSVVWFVIISISIQKSIQSCNNSCHEYLLTFRLLISFIFLKTPCFYDAAFWPTFDDEAK